MIQKLEFPIRKIGPNRLELKVLSGHQSLPERLFSLNSI